ncbi:hypothetical protein DPMN_027025 [Dreissena polymorpha]|uniref:Uncharacterized protein n=1 Tax=Dreissena polymorpha TaxID=45954 RepID=A0A9D4RE12_DREPO|nr:hypothetical protein DPMN_027025 [Dreissena polymorpha]
MNFVGYCVLSTNDTQLRYTEHFMEPCTMDTTEVRSQVRSRAEKMKTSQPQRDKNSDIKENTAIRNEDAGAINKSTNDNENNNNDEYNGNDNRRRKLNIGKQS